MDVKLVVVEGRPLGAVVPIKVSPFVIGRDPSCQLRPKNPALSGRHSALYIRDKRVVIRDLGSTNGTLVNDQCLSAGEEVQAVDGDRLQVGQLIFVIRIAGDAKPLEIDSSLPEWLEQPEPMSNGDVNSQTLLLSGLSQPGESGNFGSSILPSPTDGGSLPFLFQEYDQIHRVLCVGLSQAHLDDEGVGPLRRALNTLATKPQHRRVVLDLADVETLPVATYTLLLNAAHRWKNLRGQLRLCSLSPAVQRMVNTLRLDGMISCYVSRYEASSDPWE